VALDERGKLDLEDLHTRIDRAWRESRPVMMVVSMVGTTERGEIDPVHRVVELLEEYEKSEGRHIWHHAVCLTQVGELVR